MKSKLKYLRWLTDDFGIWQHTDGDEIHKEMGYALDDAARGLIVFLDFGDKENAKICLDYLIKSKTAKGFVGFYDGERNSLDQLSSHDAHCLALWALAYAIKKDFYKAEALRVFNETPTERITSKGYLRALSYLLLAYSNIKDEPNAKKIADILLGHFKPDLGWFEERLTYANAALPLALLEYRRAFDVKSVELDRYLKQSLETLEDYCRLGVIPSPVGNRIWQRIGGVERDIYGQQPIDPGFMVLALVEAHRNFNEPIYLKKAEDWMSWFHGNNIYKTSLITDDFACRDGLYEMPRGVCNNKGAESTIMYLMALYNLEKQKGK